MLPFVSSLDYHSRLFPPFGKIEIRTIWSALLDAHENAVTSAKKFCLCEKLTLTAAMVLSAKHHYKNEDIFNRDETAAFYRLGPKQTSTFRGEKCIAGKHFTSRVTVFL
ncbi:hypothetical protein T4E_1481 [Trichinella pseudospiralis]|uniref:Uncharacterized protein n=1 Tax=Trichinella pseudospiralis TaxID=6337 RepID=A0A0V0XN25_TRIPS|nr:hypothetical protein T4E_1481 [Trichinella pseudospiralis]